MKQSKIDQAIIECLTLLYAQATPPADFQQLMDNATVDKDGRKVIPYDKHELEEDKWEPILQQVTKKYKLNTFQQKQLNFNIYLGASPKTKFKNK